MASFAKWIALPSDTHRTSVDLRSPTFGPFQRIADARRVSQVIMTDVSCPVCKCKDWDHGIECIVTRLVRMLETQRMRAEEVYPFDEAFLKACGIE